jgi:Arc/MetJ-type ribon-helix-helix transcriptional regulator
MTCFAILTGSQKEVEEMQEIDGKPRFFPRWRATFPFEFSESPTGKSDPEKKMKLDYFLGLRIPKEIVEIIETYVESGQSRSISEFVRESIMLNLLTLATIKLQETKRQQSIKKGRELLDLLMAKAGYERKIQDGGSR